MSKFDFKGTGMLARVNNNETAIQIFEDYDIPYHLITKGENEGRIKVKAIRDQDCEGIMEFEEILKENGCGDLIEHAAIFRDVDDELIFCYSPYHMPYKSIGEDGKVQYRVPEIYGYESEVRVPGIYVNLTSTVVFRRK